MWLRICKMPNRPSRCRNNGQFTWPSIDLPSYIDDSCRYVDIDCTIYKLFIFSSVYCRRSAPFFQLVLIIKT